MTRFCIRCNRIIGEKCVRCGREATANSNVHAVTAAEFDCPSCGNHFAQGDGGETGGMCEPCFDAELRKARECAGKTAVKEAGPGSATGTKRLGREHSAGESEPALRFRHPIEGRTTVRARAWKPA